MPDWKPALLCPKFSIYHKTAVSGSFLLTHPLTPQAFLTAAYLRRQAQGPLLFSECCQVLLSTIYATGTQHSEKQHRKQEVVD